MSAPSSATSLTPHQLLVLVELLPEALPKTKAMEMNLGIGVGFNNAWYSSQKEHWQAWLADYHGPGAYGRIPRDDRTAQSAYNRIRCAPMLFWLAEAAEVPQPSLDKGYGAVMKAGSSTGRQCAALRREISWGDVFYALC